MYVYMCPHRNISVLVYVLVPVLGLPVPELLAFMLSMTTVWIHKYSGDTQAPPTLTKSRDAYREELTDVTHNYLVTHPSYTAFCYCLIGIVWLCYTHTSIPATFSSV